MGKPIVAEVYWTLVGQCAVVDPDGLVDLELIFVI